MIAPLGHIKLAGFSLPILNILKEIQIVLKATPDKKSFAPGSQKGGMQRMLMNKKRALTESFPIEDLKYLQNITLTGESRFILTHGQVKA